MKKAIFACLMMLIVFSACSDKNPKITVLGENSSSIQSMQKLKEVYETENKVVLDFRPNSFEDAFNKANQDFANKTGQYDIVLQYNFSLSSFIKNDYVYKLDELKANSKNDDYRFENDIFENVWKEVGYFYLDPSNPNDDEITAVAYPFAANTMLLVYNKELFSDPIQQNSYKIKYGKELTVPSDLETFKNVAEFFTQPDKGISGICLQGSTGGWLYYEWSSFVQGFGGKILDKDQGWKGNSKTPILLNSREVKDATMFYKSLLKFNSGNFFTVDGVEQRNIIKKGNVAMGIIWSDYIWGLISNEDGSIDSRFGFSPTPGNKSMIAGGAFYINKQSKNKNEAFNYIKYLLNKENQIKMIENGLCSPIKSAYDMIDEQKVPYIKALKESLLRAEYMLEAGPDADYISNIITTYIQKICKNEISIDEGLESAAMEIEKGRGVFFK